MSTYSSSATNFGRGNSFSTSWVSPEASANFADNGERVWARFTGATALLAATVSSATLTIGNIGAPGSSETITVKGDKTSSDAGLPSDWTAASGRTLTTASATTPDLSSLTSHALDVTSVVQEIVAAIDGDELMLVMEDLTYSGTGMIGLTASLSVTYTGGGGGPSTLLLILLDQNA